MRTCSTAFNTTLALALALLTICGGEALARERGRAPLGKPTLRVIPRPRNTNTAGGVFGGWMMSQMNQAANAVVGGAAAAAVGRCRWTACPSSSR